MMHGPNVLNPQLPTMAKRKTVEEMQFQKIGNYEAFIEYMNTVFARTERWLARLTPEDFKRGGDPPAASAATRQYFQRPDGG